MKEIFKRLKKKFGFFQSNDDYYYQVLKSNNDYDLAREQILKDLKNDWQINKGTWFKDLLNNAKNILKSLEYALEICSKYGLETDLDFVASFFKDNINLKDRISSLFENKEINYQTINKLSDNSLVQEFLTNYIVVLDTSEKLDNLENNFFETSYHGTDTFTDYLNAISQFEMLTFEELVECFKKMENLYPNISDEKILKQYRKLQEKIFEANVRLVISIAKRYKKPGIDIMDLIQEGNVGLMQAIKKYDYHLGIKFSTYAIFGIRNSIINAIPEKMRTIKLPRYVLQKLKKITYVKDQLTEELGHEPTDSQLAQKMQIDIKKLKKYQMIQQDPVSLNTPVGEDSDVELGSLLPDEDSISPEDAALHSVLKKNIEKILKRLSPRERDLIELRFGLKDGICHTLDYVGNKYDITRERVRQIEAKTLKLIRAQLNNDNSDDMERSEKGITFWQLIGKKQQRMIRKVKLLPIAQRLIIYKSFGSNLAKPCHDSSVRPLINSIINNLLFFTLKKDYLFDELNTSTENIKRLHDSLDCSTIQYTILSRVYGADWLGRANLTKYDAEYIAPVIEWIKDALNALNEKNKDKNIKGLRDFIKNCSDQVYKNAINLKDGTIRKIIEKYFGSDFTGTVDLRKITHQERAEISKIVSYLNNKVDFYEGVSLQQELNVSLANFNQYVVFYKNRFEYYYDELARYFGAKLNKRIVVNQLDVNAYGEILNCMKHFISYYEKYKLIFLKNILECTEEELNILISVTDGELILKVYQNYSENIDKNKESLFYLEKLKNKLNIIRDCVKKYDRIHTPLDLKSFKPIGEFLPQKYRSITSLRLGLIDGYIYSISELSELFGISEQEVNNLLELGINSFKEIAKNKELDISQVLTLKRY